MMQDEGAHDGFKTVAIPTVLASVAYAMLALALGQDANFDQQNYHFYAPYALLNDRILFDIFPAFLGPTFHNPIPYLPFYWLAAHAPPMLIGALFGAVQGLAFAPLYYLARTLPPEPLRTSRLAAALLAALGLTGAIAISEAGTSFIDSIVSALALSGVAAIAAAMPRLTSAPLARAILWTMVAGFPVGLAAGFKLTMLVYCAAFVLALGVIARRPLERLGLMVAAGVGVVAGVLACGGPWFAIMWAKTGNPTFPYLNQLFHSPLALAQSYRDVGSIPTSLGDALLVPFLALRGSETSVAEVAFFDLRIPVLYTLALIAAGFVIVRRPLPLNPAARFTLAFVAVGYGLWLPLFSIWRYLLPIEMLAPLLVAVLLGAMAPVARRPRVAASVTAAVLSVIAVTTVAADWGRVPWSRELYGVRVPPIPQPEQALILMAGIAPTAFLIPFFPRIPFVRLEGFSDGLWDTSGGLAHSGEQRVRAHEGDIYLLFAANHRPNAELVASHFSLALDPAACNAVESRLQPSESPHGPVLLCLVQHDEVAP